jgi:hypothetical protein
LSFCFEGPMRFSPWSPVLVEPVRMSSLFMSSSQMVWVGRSSSTYCS